FVQGTTQISFGSGITTNSVVVTDSTHLTVQISVDPAAFISARTVSAVTGGENASLANVFTVVASGNPTITSVAPNTGLQGQANLSVVITGQNTHFIQGTTNAS